MMAAAGTRTASVACGTPKVSGMAATCTTLGIPPTTVACGTLKLAVQAATCLLTAGGVAMAAGTAHVAVLAPSSTVLALVTVIAGTFHAAVHAARATVF